MEDNHNINNNEIKEKIDKLEEQKNNFNSEEHKLYSDTQNQNIIETNKIEQSENVNTDKSKFNNKRSSKDNNVHRSKSSRLFDNLANDDRYHPLEKIFLSLGPNKDGIVSADYILNKIENQDKNYKSNPIYFIIQELSIIQNEFSIEFLENYLIINYVKQNKHIKNEIDSEIPKDIKIKLEKERIRNNNETNENILFNQFQYLCLEYKNEDDCYNKYLKEKKNNTSRKMLSKSNVNIDEDDDKQYRLKSQSDDLILTRTMLYNIKMEFEDSLRNSSSFNDLLEYLKEKDQDYMIFSEYKFIMEGGYALKKEEILREIELKQISRACKKFD